MPSIPSDAGLGSMEDDGKLNERILKAHSDLSDLHKIISKGGGMLRDSGGPAARTRSRTGSLTQRDTLRQQPPPLDIDYQKTSVERMGQISHMHDANRSDRMRLAELSDERISKEEAGDLRSGKARMSPVKRSRVNAMPLHTKAKELREFSKKALNFTDDDDAPSKELGSEKHLGELGEARTRLDLQVYVRQMEETIAQLVQQKDELLRNQVEFDKQASGIFPSLVNLNRQLSQIVQGKLLQSGQSHNHDDVATLHDDMLDELRVQREQLSELEADSKRRKYDAELQEQNLAIEISQIKADLIALVASGKMRDERIELMSESHKKLQQDLQEAIKNIVLRYQLQTPTTQPRLVGRRSQYKTFLSIIAMLLGIISVVIGFIIVGSGDCGVMRCRPLI